MASADYSVLTPERVSLEYGIAGVGSRAGAAIVDTLIQAAAVTVLAIAFFVTIGLGAAAHVLQLSDEAIGLVGLALVLLASFMITSGYFMIFEIIWNGQTPGKRLVGVRVIRESGYPLRPVDSVVRNLVRIVDWAPVFYGIGVLVMLFNRRAKRLGDFAAGTLVVREGARQSLASVPASVGASDEPRGVALSGADATLVRDFLVRRESMHPTARKALAQRLATALAQRYQLPLQPEEEPEGFLNRLT
jgi:uncharacterized RDD family membrane protein YckC